MEFLDRGVEGQARPGKPDVRPRSLPPGPFEQTTSSSVCLEPRAGWDPCGEAKRCGHGIEGIVLEAVNSE